MLGHKLPPVQGAYNKPSPTALKQEYLRVLPYLTIKEKVETRIVTDKRLEEMEKREKERDLIIDRLNREVAMLKSQDKVKK